MILVYYGAGSIAYTAIVRRAIAGPNEPATAPSQRCPLRLAGPRNRARRPRAFGDSVAIPKLERYEEFREQVVHVVLLPHPRGRTDEASSGPKHAVNSRLERASSIQPDVFSVGRRGQPGP